MRNDVFTPNIRSLIVKTLIVKDLMVPIAEYATVTQGSTLYDAVLALEKAHAEFNYEHTPYHHRAVLVQDSKKRVIGILSQFDVLRGLEPENEKREELQDIAKFHFSPNLIAEMREQYRMSRIVLEDLYQEASARKVEDYMQSPSENQYVDENASLDTAIDRFDGIHQGLLVAREKDIVGVLRLSDVFLAVCRAMKDGAQRTTKDSKQKTAKKDTT
jgi:CBS domain-containing protein